MVAHIEMQNDDDAVFHALADENRRRLLDLLQARNGRTLVELYCELGVSRQAAAKHLMALEAANLVTFLRLGREKLHFINPAPINAIAERWINKFDRARLGALSELKRNLEGEDHA